MKRENLLSKKAVVIAICGALIIGALGLSLIQSQAASGKNGIDSEKATAIALENAGFKQEEAVNLVTKFDLEDGRKAYEVDFYAGGFEYDYLIAASDGVILEAKREAMDAEDYREAGLENPNAKVPAKTPAQSTQTTKPAQNSGTSNYIGTDKAKSIALQKAGVASSDATFTKAKLDKDDGVYVYEIEFISGAYEYEVEINATSGKVLDYDIDSIDD
ncbi:MAG: PepSY domain-containing protein [Firmicutes bacterium]|nr:PepSY domain-containing protein [Bacillota bacterium]